MHTQSTATTPAAIYWTAQAESEWYDRRNASLAWDATRPTSRGDVERYAISTGAQCVNRAVIDQFFEEGAE